MTEEKKLTPAEWGKTLGKRRRMLGIPGAMRGASIPMDKLITQAEFERAMNEWRKKPAYISRVAPPQRAVATAKPAEDLEVVHPADPAPARGGGEKGGKK